MLRESMDLLSRSPIPLPTRNTQLSVLPIGIGFITWGAPLTSILSVISVLPLPPAALWLFAPNDIADLAHWTYELRNATHNLSKIWIQIGSVAEALTVAGSCAPDVLVVQGIDAGGHGLQNGASLVTLLPEVRDALAAALASGAIARMPILLAAGGVADGRGVAAALALGAKGAVMGTRYLASTEAALPPGHQNEVIRATDGGQTTVRSRVYDTLRGTVGWPAQYGGRGVVNASYEDWVGGKMGEDENKKMYEEASKLGDKGWGPKGRMTTYAGTAVGLVKRVQGAEEITNEVREECRRIVDRLPTKL